MNEQLDNAAVDALVSIVTNAARAKEFVLSELPEVVEQLLAWKLVESIAVNLICLAAIIAIAVNIIKLVAFGSKDNWKGDAVMVWVFITIGITTVIIITSFFLMNLAWIQIWIAPKVYLLEYASELVR